MKVLIDCHPPFSIAHGGMQTQIEQTKGNLEKVGVEVEYLRWWDDRQTGDILHYFGRMPVNLMHLAKDKGMKVVMSELLTAQGSRSGWSDFRPTGRPISLTPGMQARNGKGLGRN